MDGYSAGTPHIINQVGRGTSPSTSTPLGGYFNTSTMQDLRRRCTTPVFSGEVRDWESFVREWEQYSRLYTIRLPEAVKLDLFKTCLPDHNPLAGKPRLHLEPIFVDGHSAGTPHILNQVGRGTNPSTSTPLGGYC